MQPETMELLLQVGAMLGALFGIWAGFKARLAVLEAEVSSIKASVDELRHDIRRMLMAGCPDSRN